MKTGRFIPISILSILLFFCLSATAQQATDSSFVLLTNVAGKIQHFTTDKLQQFYIVTPRNELIKYNRNGKELFRYNNNRLGTLSLVDATNPFNLLLYYPEYMTVITLDRTLNETSTFNFFDLDFTDVQAIGMSNDNNIWLYDDIRFTLKKIDNQGKVLQESSNLNLTLGGPIAPNFIIERDNQVYVNVPGQGILIFDSFAKYLRTIQLQTNSSFQVQEELLLYFKEEELLVFDSRSLLHSQIRLPAKAAQVRLQKNHLYLATAEGLKVYRKNSKIKETE